MRSDDALMQVLGRGAEPARERAFTELVERHGAGLTAFVWRLTGDRAVADDVVQETFLRVFTARERYREGRASFRTWLYRIARNQALNTMRRRRVRRSEPLFEAADTQRSSPLEGLIGTEDVAQLRAALAALPPADQEVIELRYYQGMSFAEVGEVVGARASAVKQRAWRCLKRLGASLGGEEES